MANNECPIWNTLAEQIRSEPMKAMILAFGAGLLLCFLPVGQVAEFSRQDDICTIETGVADPGQLSSCSNTTV